MKPSLTTAAGAATAPRALRAPRSRRGAPAVLAVLAVGAAALGSFWAIAQWDGKTSTLSGDVQAFQQRVTAGTGSPSGAAAAEVLARRYLDSLAPDLRQRIADQVRAEQRAGLTPEGNDAFVMRRLALYEEALQQAGTVAVARPGGTVEAR